MISDKRPAVKPRIFKSMVGWARISSQFVPNVCTISCAVASPTYLIKPLDKNRTAARFLLSILHSERSTKNCVSLYFELNSHEPSITISIFLIGFAIVP